MQNKEAEGLGDGRRAEGLSRVKPWVLGRRPRLYKEEGRAQERRRAESLRTSTKKQEADRFREAVSLRN